VVIVVLNRDGQEEEAEIGPFHRVSVINQTVYVDENPDEFMSGKEIGFYFKAAGQWTFEGVEWPVASFDIVSTTQVIADKQTLERYKKIAEKLHDDLTEEIAIVKQYLGE
jgi:hypothetical protein